MVKLSLAKGLRFPLWSPIKEMIRLLKLQLHVSQSPQYRNPPSWFASRSHYKEGDSPFPKTSLTCLTLLSEFPLKRPSFQAPPTYRNTLRLQNFLLLSLKIPGKRTPLQVPQWGHYGERCPVPESSLHISNMVTSTGALPQVSISDLH